MTNKYGSHITLHRDTPLPEFYEPIKNIHRKVMILRRRFISKNSPHCPLAIVQDCLDEAVTFSTIGKAHHSKGEYDKALQCHKEALQIRRRALGDHQGFAPRKLISIPYPPCFGQIIPSLVILVFSQVVSNVWHFLPKQKSKFLSLSKLTVSSYFPNIRGMLFPPPGREYELLTYHNTLIPKI